MSGHSCAVAALAMTFADLGKAADADALYAEMLAWAWLRAEKPPMLVSPKVRPSIYSL